MSIVYARRSMFKRIVKITGIVLLSGVGLIGIVAGILAIQGKFSEQRIIPQSLSFATYNTDDTYTTNNTYYVDDSMSGDALTFKVVATPEDTTVNDISLDIKSGDNLIQIITENPQINEPIQFALKSITNYNSNGLVEIEAYNYDNTIATTSALKIYIDRVTEAVSIYDRIDTTNNTIEFEMNETNPNEYELDSQGRKIVVTKDIDINVGDEYELSPIFLPSYSNHPLASRDAKIVEYYILDENDADYGSIFSNDGKQYVRGERVGTFTVLVATYDKYTEQDRLHNNDSIMQNERLAEMVTSQVTFHVNNIAIDEVAMDGTAPAFTLYEPLSIVLNNPVGATHDLGIKLYKDGEHVSQKLQELRFYSGSELPTQLGTYLMFMSQQGSNSVNVTDYFDIQFVSGTNDNRIFAVTPLRYVANLSLKLVVVNGTGSPVETIIDNIEIDYTNVTPTLVAPNDIILEVNETNTENIDLNDYLTVSDESNIYSKVLYFVEKPVVDVDEDPLDYIPFEIFSNIRNNNDYLIGFYDEQRGIVLDELKAKENNIHNVKIYAVVVRSNEAGTIIYDSYGRGINLTEIVTLPTLIDDIYQELPTYNLSYSGTAALGSIVSSNHTKVNVKVIYQISNVELYFAEGVLEEGNDTVTSPIIDDENYHVLNTTPYVVREKYVEGRTDTHTNLVLTIKDRGTINALAYALQNATANGLTYSLKACMYSSLNQYIADLNTSNIIIGALTPRKSTGEVWTIADDIETLDHYTASIEIKSMPTNLSYLNNGYVGFVLSYSYENFVSTLASTERLRVVSGVVNELNLSKNAFYVDGTIDGATVNWTLYENSDMTDTGVVVEGDTDLFADYITINPSYALNKSYTYVSSDSSILEITYNLGIPTFNFKKGGQVTVTLSSNSNVSLTKNITINVTVPSDVNMTTSTSYTTNLNQAAQYLTYDNYQLSYALEYPYDSQLIDYDIASVKIGTTTYTDPTQWEDIISIESGVLTRNDNYKNYDIVVRVRASAPFVSNVNLDFLFSSQVQSVVNPTNTTRNIYANTNFVLAEVKTNETYTTPTSSNSIMVIKKNVETATIQNTDFTIVGLTSSQYSITFNSTISAFILNVNVTVSKDFVINFNNNGVLLTSLTLTALPNIKSVITNSDDTINTSTSRQNINCGAEIVLADYIDIKQYDNSVNYVSYTLNNLVAYEGTPTYVVSDGTKLELTNEGTQLKALWTDKTVGATSIQQAHLTILVGELNIGAMYVNVVNNLTVEETETGCILISRKLFERNNVDENSSLYEIFTIKNSSTTLPYSETVYLSNVTSLDSNLKYIVIDGVNYLIYDNFVGNETTISTTLIFEVNGCTLTYNTEIVIQPNIPTNLFTDRNSTSVGSGTLYAQTSNVSLIVSGDSGYTNPYIVYDEISYTNETIGGVLTRVYTKTIRNINCTDNISFAFVEKAQYATFDNLYEDLDFDDILTISATDGRTISIHNVGNGIVATLRMTLTYPNSTISYTTDENNLVLLLLPSDSIYVTYPFTDMENSETIFDGESLNLFAADERFNDLVRVYALDRASEEVNVTIQYFDSNYVFPGGPFTHQNIMECLTITNGVITINSSIANYGNGTITFLLTTASGASALYNINVVTDATYTYTPDYDDNAEKHIVKQETTEFDLYANIMILDKYDLAVTSEKVSAYVIEGQEFVVTEIDDNKKLSSINEITFTDIYSKSVIVLAIVVSENGNTVYIGNYVIWLIPDVEIVNSVANWTTDQDNLEYTYTTTAYVDTDYDFDDNGLNRIFALTYDENILTPTIELSTGNSSYLTISGATITIKQVPSTQNYKLVLKYSLDALQPDFEVVINLVVNPANYINTTNSTSANARELTYTTDFATNKFVVAVDEFAGIVPDSSPVAYMIESTDITSITETAVTGYTVKGGWTYTSGHITFNLVSNETLIKLTLNTSFGYSQNVWFKVIPDINVATYISAGNEGNSTTNRAVSVLNSATDSTNLYIGSSIDIKDYISMTHKSSLLNYIINEPSRILITALNDNEQQYIHSTSGSVVNFIHTAANKNIALRIQILFAPSVYFATDSVIYATITKSYGLTPIYMVQGAEYEVRGDITNGGSTLTLEALLSSLGTTYIDYGVNPYRFSNTYLDGEETKTSKLSCENLKTLLLLNPLSASIDYNAVKISTSDSEFISYDALSKIFSFHYSANDYESIYLTNDTGLNVEYRIKIVNTYENTLTQAFSSNVATIDAKNYQMLTLEQMSNGINILGKASDIGVYATYAVNANLGDSLQIYLSINESTFSLVNIGAYLAYNGTTGVYSYNNIDTGITNEPYKFIFRVVSKAGYLGEIRFVVLPDMTYQAGYSLESQGYELMYGNTDYLSIFGNDSNGNKRANIIIDELELNAAKTYSSETYYYSVALSVTSINSNTKASMSESAWNTYVSQYVDINNNFFKIKAVADDTRIVLKVTVLFYTSIEYSLTSYDYVILAQNHLDIDIPFAENNLLNIYLADFDIDAGTNTKIINLGSTTYYTDNTYAFVALKNLSTGTYISSNVLEYSTTSTSSYYTLSSNGQLVFTRETKDTLTIPITIKTPALNYSKNFTLNVYPTYTVSARTPIEAGFYTTTGVYVSGSQPYNSLTNYELVSGEYDNDSVIGLRIYSDKTEITKNFATNDFEMTRIADLLDPNDILQHKLNGYYTQYNNTNVVLKYQVATNTSLFAGWSVSSDSYDATLTNTSGSLYSTTLPIVNANGPQIVTYKLMLPSYTGGASELNYYFCVYVSNDSLVDLVNTENKTFSILSYDDAPKTWDLFENIFELNDVDGDDVGITPAEYLSQLWAKITIKSGVTLTTEQTSYLTIERDSLTGSLLLKLDNTSFPTVKFKNEIVFDLAFTNGVDGNIIKTFTNMKIALSAVLTPITTYDLVELGFVTSQLGDLANESVIGMTTSDIASIVISNYVTNATSISTSNLVTSLSRFESLATSDEIYSLKVLGTGGNLYTLESDFYILKMLVPRFIIEKESLYRNIRYMNPNFEGITYEEGVFSGDNSSLTLDICNEFVIKDNVGNIITGQVPYVNNDTVLYTYNDDTTAVSIVDGKIKIDTEFLYEWTSGNVLSNQTTITFDVDVYYDYGAYTITNTMTIIVNRPDTLPI